ncbi:MAG TPA: metallophosphoesterase [Bacteroidota bacterium]|nr:metallophosphoesterase [Bacteroidota bacterium]
MALTDIHGSYDKAEEIIKREIADVLVIGGDLTTVGTVKEADSAIKRFQRYTAQVFCVAGNMDLPQHDDLFMQLGVSINGQGRVVDNVGFFGVSASPHSPLHTPYELSEEEISKRIQVGFSEVDHCEIKIFVPHVPPFGTKVDIVHAGYHVGSSAVREFIENEQPHVVICGHIHEARGQDSIDKSMIVNCGQASNGFFAVIQISDEIQIMTHKL